NAAPVEVGSESSAIVALGWETLRH
ncbi:MAG: hypothetical protein RLZZ338_2033, partial [Cyanobacteriota bacterium]